MEFPMKPGLHKNKDFWAGMMLIGIGAGAMFISRDYRFGSALRMGPGFFPTVLGGLLIAFGICIVAVGLRSGEKIQGSLSLRALVMQVAGFIPALVVLVFMSAASGREFKLMEVLLLTVVLTAASAALFIWGLGLPYALIKGF
jgi:hypothetical protein